MEVSTAAIAIPKRGNEAIGSDDALAPRLAMKPAILRPGEALRFAVADGASGSIYSGPWAALLARSFVRSRLSEDVSAWPFRRMASTWRRFAKRRLAAAHGDAIPWYLVDKLDSSAQAALLGVVLEWPLASVPKWTAWAIGDACLAHITSGRLRDTFPIRDADAFGNDPVLVPADEDAGAKLPDAQFDGGLVWEGDRLYLLTDAVAAWFIRESSESGKPWLRLDDVLDSQDAVSAEDWANGERDAGRLKNDDVTVLRLTFGPR